MKLSTEIASAAKLIGEEKAIELYAKAGFDGWDFSMFNIRRYDWDRRQYFEPDHPLTKPGYLAYARHLKQVGLDNGIVCNQSHGPFPSLWPQMEPYLKKAIECTAEAGGSICVIHPDNDSDPMTNAEMYHKLLPFAKDHGVQIAAENMWTWDHALQAPVFAACATPESFNAHLDAVDDPSLVACLDIGHAEMRTLGTNAVEMILALGPRLKALHLHDNDLFHDSHGIPGTMKIDFHAVVEALRKIGYKGWFTMEADQYLNAVAPEDVFFRMQELYSAGKRLTAQFMGAVPDCGK